MEANYAGTSFLTPDKIGKLQFASKIVNFVADRTSRKRWRLSVTTTKVFPASAGT